ncbi:MAG TPA: ferrous iron transport protein A [Methanoregula sp.]|nr:ferrous iron transport protein A [Methanoregula sp.]
MQAMPLSFLSPGTDTIVADVRAGHGMLHRLAAMGIFPGSKLSVVCSDRGSLIIAVGGTRYALSHGMAMKILVGGPAMADPGTADGRPGPFTGCCHAGHGHVHRQKGCGMPNGEEMP